MLLAALLACSSGPPPPPDVLLVTIDTLRADRVGCYGDTRASTPALDALAADGALFREAHAVAPLTVPSHATLLSGLLPRSHGMRDNGGFRLPASVGTLAEALAAAGYTTGAFVSAYVLDGSSGLDQGFATYHDGFDPAEVARVGAFGEVEHPGAEVVDAALQWWDQQRSPRLMWVHLFEPHAPWTPPASWTGDAYRGEVATADAQVGRLVEAVGDQALIVVTSDHGEGLWDHGEREHGLLLGRSVTRVPLIVRPPGGIAGAERPGARPGLDVAARPDGADSSLDLAAVLDAPAAARVVETPVSGADVAPTIADWAGAALVADGVSLRSAVQGAGLVRDPVYAETFVPRFHYGWQALFAAQDDERRLERGAWDRTCDWRSDPGCLDDAGAAPRLADTIEAGRGADEPTPGPVSEDTQAALAALGYLTTVVEVAPGAPDPRDKVEHMLDEAAATPQGDPLAAMAALVEANPGMVNARVTLAHLRLARGDGEGALAELLGVLEVYPNHPLALVNGAALARSLGHRAQAIKLAQALQAVNPDDPRGYAAEATVRLEQGAFAAALKVCTRGLDHAPDASDLSVLALVAAKRLASAGDCGAARPVLEAADGDPEAAQALERCQ